MARWLKQSTSVDVPIGPFVDQSDGFTAESGLTLTQPDIRLKKNAGAWAQKAAAQTLSHEENGNYEVTLDATDTNTLGLLRLHVNESGALPVWEDFLVVPANVYDSFFSTDLLQVDVITIANNAITSAAIATDGAAEIRSITRGTSDSGSTTTMVDSARTETDTDHWKGCFILFDSTLTGQCRLITGFNPATDTITFAPPTTAAVSTHGYEILPAARVDLHLWQGFVANSLISGRVDANTQAIGNDVITSAAAAPDFLAEVNAEVDTALADYDGPTFTELDARTDAIEADTQDIQSRLPAALVSSRMDSHVGAMGTNVITDAVVSTDMDGYAAKVWVIKEGTTADHYAVAFYKNGQRVTSGVTSPTIQVIKGSDGSDLIASTALTEIGSMHRFKKDEATNKTVAGAIYFAVVGATIDGSSRSWDQQIGRDAA